MYDREAIRGGVVVVEQNEVPCVTPTPGKRRVLVVGGGYAGTTLAVRLGRALARMPEHDIEVIVIEPSPCQQALSELDLVAAGPERPEFCELWLPAVLGRLPVRTCFNRVETIHPDRKVVVVGGGHEIDYWRLAICTGAVASIPPIPGLAERAITMWSVADAYRLRQATAEHLHHAARLPSSDERRRMLAFTVCGGGATGVEIVGTLAQYLPKRARGMGLAPGDLTVHIVQSRPQVLFELPERLRDKATRRLERMGVDVVTGSPATRVTEDEVILEDGRRVPASVVVWAGGAKADPHAVEWGLDVDESHRIVVDSHLKVEGHEDVYALGDVAAFRDPHTGRNLAMLAQHAIAQGKHVAISIVAEIGGAPTRPFGPSIHGEFVSVGPGWGVGWIWRPGLQFSGIPAILLKRLTYVGYWREVGGVRMMLRRTKELIDMHM